MLIKPRQRISRRFLLRSALAAPALLLSGQGDAAFQTFMASRTPAVDPLFKPNGSPTLIANAMTSGMLNYVFDTGTGLYNLVKDCTPAHAINPTSYYGAMPNYAPGSTPFDPKQSLALPHSTPYGDAIAWSSGLDSQTPGGGALIQLAGTDELRDVINLAARGTGAGCTIFATHRTTGQNRSGTIYGRFQNMDVLAHICTIFSANSINSDYRIAFGWSAAADGMSPQFIYSANNFFNVLCTTVVSMINTAPGVTNIKMYVNGALEVEVSNQTVRDIAASVAFNEDQLQWGTGFHVYAGQSYNSYNGEIFQAGTRDGTWLQADAASLAASPYQNLQF